MDTIIDSMGVGYGTQYMCSRQSNVLQLALLADNIEVVNFLLQKSEQDANLQLFFWQPNNRRQSVLFTAAMCWRSRSGQLTLQSKLIQLEICQQRPKYESLNVLQVIRQTNCAYLGKLLNIMIQSDNQLRSTIYDMILMCDAYIMGDHGTPLEKQYVAKYYDLLLRDAMNYCLKHKEAIQWYNAFESYCKRHQVVGQGLTIQFSRAETCDVEKGIIVVAEQYLEMALKKLKPLQQGSGSALSVLPG